MGNTIVYLLPIVGIFDFSVADFDIRDITKIGQCHLQMTGN